MFEPLSKPKTILRKNNSVTLNWEDTFPPKTDNEHIYRLQIFNDLHEWVTIYWCWGLRSSEYFSFRINIHDEDANWVEFKSATETDHFYVRHLTRAVKLGKIALIRKIIAHRPSLLEIENDNGKPHLMQAVENGDMPTVNSLVNYGANINQQSSFNKRTSLMMAMHGGHLEIGKFLIQKGGLTNLKDTNDMTILHYAVESNCYETVEFVLGLGTDINSVDYIGWTPLIRAVVMEASDAIIKLLLLSGSDPNIRDKKGYDFKKFCQISNRVYLMNYMRIT